MLGERLKQLRLVKSVGQKDVAKYLGITTSAYGFYEQEKRRVDHDTLEKLADYFNVSIDYLLGRSSNNYGNALYLGEVNEESKIPVYSLRETGEKILTQENIIGWQIADVADEMSYISFEIIDNSMENSRIRTGDRIVVRKCDKAENGDLVVAIYKNKAYVRKLKTIANNEVLLYPDNTSSFEPIIAKLSEIKVIGVVEQNILKIKK